MYKKLITIITLGLTISCGLSGSKDSSGDNSATGKEPNSVISDDIIFQENFDTIPDWTSGNSTPPKNWERFRDGEEQWNPDNGHPDREHTMQILASNSDKARGGVGKSFVIYRESVDKGGNYWTTDAILSKSLKEGLNEVYVEFYIMFSPDFTASNPSGSSKIFRISSNDSAKKGREHEYYLGFNNGHNGPMLIQVYGVGGYGARNFLAFRGDPYYDFEGNSLYYLGQGEMGNLRRQINRGDVSFNYADDLIGMGKNGEDPKVPDQVNGGFLSPHSYDPVSHEQIYGPLGTWAKFAYYVKMNSGPNIADGVFIQWINDTQIQYNDGITWHRYRPDGDIPKWNSISFGGNNYFPRYKDLDRFEDWYTIDDITIRKGIPKELR